jgi:D-alanyl-D-alanine carboxypeptidase (penicillin-binding protein 5/6)
VPTLTRRAVRAASASILLLLLAPAAAAQQPGAARSPTATQPVEDVSGLPASQTVPNEPAGWILIDADTGAVLGGREVRTPHLPASTIKLFTALVAAQRLPADEPIPISAQAAGMPARRIAVGAGQTWDLEDLLASMLTVSANDAAVAVAERVGGGSLAGWEDVASVAAAGLGLEDSPDLSDPAGLDDEFSHGEGSHISPRDLAIVSRAVLAEPLLMELVAIDEHRFTGGDGIVHSVDRRNQFLDLYPGAIGMKTGLTDAAGRCLVAAATREGRTMLAVLFDAPDMYLTAATLLDRGFAIPVDAQDGLPHLPDVVPDAALDPPAAVAGAVEPDLGVVTEPGSSGFAVDSPAVALAILVVGTVPALALRRRLLRRVPDHP